MATKTKNIADLASISGKSASLLGKTPSNSVGYIAGLLDAQGNIAGLSDIKDQIAQLESLKTELQNLTQNITELQETVGGIEENTEIQITNAFNERITIKGPNGTSYMNNEESGGILKFTKNSGEVGKVTIFDGTDSDGTYVQLVAHNQDKSNIAKINFTVNGAYYSKDSSTTVAIPDNELVTKKDIQHIASDTLLQDHTSNTDIHVTKEDKEKWNAKVDESQLQEQLDSTKQDIIDEVQGELDAQAASAMHYKGQVATEGELPGADQQLGDIYNVEDTGANYAWNGTSWDKLSEDLSGFATQESVEELGGRVDTLEGITVDQTFNGESTNAQSGTAVAEAVKDLATKTELAEKADQSTVESLTERVETVEAIEVDQTYNSKSTNAQSGTAVAEAIQNEKVVKFGGHTAYMANETSGGLIKFTKNTGEIAKVTTFDGSDGEQTFIQLVTQNGDKSKTAKINFTLDGAFYSKTTGEPVAVADNELVVKKDIKELVPNADLSGHTSNTDIHVTKEDKEKWNAKVDESKLQEELGAAKQEVEEKLQGEITAKLEAAMHYKGQVATEGELPEADQELGDIYNVEETGANYAWNGTSWDKLSEDLSGFATKTEMEAQLELKGDKVDYDQMKEFYEHVQQDLAGHMANTNVHFEAGEKETWKSQLDGLKDLDSKYALRSELAKKTDLTTYNELEARVDILEAVPKITVDQVWDQYSENPQSGIAIQSALDNYVTDEDLSVEMLKKANKGDFDALDDRVEILEAKPDPTVDQMFQKDSHNAQSGTAVDNAISTLATKEQFHEHADNTDIHVTAEDKEKWNDTYSKSDIDSKVEEKANASELPKYVLKNVTGEAGVVLTQIYAHDLEDTTSSRLNVHIDGIYYTKNAESDEVSADNEILTKADIKDLVASSTVTDLSDRVTALEEKPEPTVDQTYDAESTNAQSGTAVAEAIAPIATKADQSALTAHTSNEDIHVTSANKAAWDAKASAEKLESLKTEMLSEIASKIKGVMHYKGQVANKEALPIIDQIEGDLYDVGDTGANYIWTGAAWDKLSEDAAGTEALQEHIADTNVHVSADLKSKLSDLYTKAEIDAKLEEKGGKLDYEQIKNLVDTLTNELDTHETDETRHFAVDEKAQWEAKLNGMDTLYVSASTYTAKIAELEAKITELEEKITALQGS